MKKRLFSLLLAITLVLGMMPANVFATTVVQEEDPTCQHTAHTTAYAQVEGTATHTAMNRSLSSRQMKKQK